MYRNILFRHGFALYIKGLLSDTLRKYEVTVAVVAAYVEAEFKCNNAREVKKGVPMRQRKPKQAERNFI